MVERNGDLSAQLVSREARFKGLEHQHLLCVLMAYNKSNDKTPILDNFGLLLVFLHKFPVGFSNDNDK